MHTLIEEAFVNIGFNVFGNDDDKTSFVDDLHFDEQDFDDFVLELKDLLKAKGIDLEDDALREIAFGWQTLGDASLFLDSVSKVRTQ